MSESSNSRITSDRIPKITAASNDYDVWIMQMESLLRAYDLFNVVVHPVAAGGVEARARSKGRSVIAVKDVEDTTVSLFMELEGEELKVEVTSGGKDEQTSATPSVSNTSTSSMTAGGTKKLTDAEKIAMRQKLVMKSMKAHSVLMAALDKDLIRLFGDVSMGDANALWTMMERHFTQSNTSAGEIASLTKELASIKMIAKRNGTMETIQEFVAKIKGIMARLDALKAPANQMNVMIRFIQAVEETGLSNYTIACAFAWRDIDNGTAKSIDDLAKNFIRESVRSLNSCAAAASSVSQNDSGNYVNDWKESNGRGRGRGGRGRGSGRGRGGRGGRFETETRTCYSCGESGHLRHDCKKKQPRNENKGSPIICFECEGKGHVATECPTRIKRESKGKSCSENADGKKKSDKAELVSDKESTGRVVDGDLSFAAVVKGGLVKDPSVLKMNVDSGSTVTIIPDKEFLSSVIENAKEIIVGTADANSGNMISTNVGTMKVADDLVLGRVAVIPTIAEPLLSVAALTDSNAEVRFLPGNGGVRVIKNGEEIMRGNRIGNRFEIEIATDRAAVVSDQAMIKIKSLHSKLGHLSASSIERNQRAGLYNDTGQRWSKAELREALKDCTTCALTKIQRKATTGRGDNNILEFGDRVYADLAGPFRLKKNGVETASIDNSKYYLVVREARRRLLFVATINGKNDAPQRAKEFIALLETISGRRLKEFHSDGDAVFTSDAFTSWCRARGTMPTTTTRDTPEHNGMAERSVRSINEMMRAILKNAGLPHAFWPLAAKTAAYILNRSIGAGDAEKVPIEYATKERPDLSKLHVFGCDVVYQIPPSDRGNRQAKDEDAENAETLKLRPIGAKGIFVGYSDDGRESYYRVYDTTTRKIVKVRSVIFTDNSFEEAKRIQGLDQFIVDNELEEEQSQSSTGLDDDDIDDDDFVETNNDIIDVSEEKNSAIPSPDLLEPVDKKLIINDPPIPMQRARRETESKQQSMKKAFKGYSGETVPVVVGPQVWKIEHKTKVDERNIISGSRRRQPPKDIINAPVINSAVLDKMPELEEKVRVNWDPTKYSIVESDDDDDDDDMANMIDDNDGTPLTFEEATTGPDAKEWWASMRDEMKSQNATNSFRLVKRSKGMNVLPTKWIYKDKKNENGNITKKKSRLVPKGFRQRYGIDYDETFAPTARQASWRTILSRAAARGMKILQGDVPTAFLKGELHHEIYMEQPEGFVEAGPNGEELVWHLQRPIYGIKQAPREWYLELRKSLTSLLKMTQCVSEPTVYVRQSKSGNRIIFLIWVDDTWACYHDDDEEECKLMLKALSDKYGIKEWKPSTSIIGMRINYDEEKGEMKIDQEVYANELVKKFGMENCATLPSPQLDKELKSADISAVIDKELLSKYRAGVGGLLWLSTQTKPALAYAVGVLSRYMKNPQKEHYSAMKKIFRYVKESANTGLIYKRSNRSACRIEAFCDADWAMDKNDRKSTSGYLIYVDGNLVLWGSRKQKSVALSTAEAEYMAISTAVEEIKWLAQFLREIGETVEEPSICYSDNMAAKLISQSEVGSKRTKHIDIRHHFIKEEVESGRLKIDWISTKKQLADMMTKVLPKDQFNALLKEALNREESDKVIVLEEEKTKKG